MAAWLNGYAVLWHPALLLGTTAPPKVDSAYDHEQPSAGRAYVLPDSPPQFLPDDWADRVRGVGAIKLTTSTDRASTVSAMLDAVRDAATSDEGREHFGSPEQAQLLTLPPEAIRPFVGLGFGYLVIDSLFEAMDHEKLIDVSGLWFDVQNALQALLKPDGAAEVDEHLRLAAGKLLSAREVLYAVNIHLLDVWNLTEDNLDGPVPAGLSLGNPLNVMATGRALERLAEQFPDRANELRAKFDESIQPPILEVIGGTYREREDGLMPIGSQLWNLRKGRSSSNEAIGATVEVLARKKSANHPNVPSWVQVTGLRRAMMLSFDGAVVPSYRATVVNWTAPDGKSIDAFTRAPQPAHKAETFFNLVYTLHTSISQDSAPTLAIMHQGEPANPLYDDWLALSKLGPALGEWTTFSRYFSDALAGEYIGTTNADEFFSDYLEERTNAHRPDPVSAFGAHMRARRRVESAYTLAAIQRSLSASGPTDEDNRELENLKRYEDDLEATGLSPLFDPSASPATPERRWAEKLAERLQGRSTANQPGVMLLNPCAFTRRVAVEIEGVTGHLAIEGPVKASQTDGGVAKTVVEVPPLGFAWVPRTGGSAPNKPRIRLADGNMVRNEYFEAEIDPATGGIKSFRDVRTRAPRVGMQVVYNPGSRAEGTGFEVTQSGSALGEIVSKGRLLNEQNEELATFRVRLRSWLSRPVLDLRVEIEPAHLPTGYPWHAYYGVRFAWRDERAAIMRGVNGLAAVSGHTRPVSPDFVEVRLGRMGTTILTGGLPFVQRHGNRMLDAILIPEGETVRSFDLGLALDRDYPMQAAVGMVSPIAMVPTTKGPPHIGPSGWLFQIDTPNLLLHEMRPVADGSRAFIATLQETTGSHGGTAELRCVRDPVSASFVDGDDHATSGLTIEGDAVRLEYAAGELFRIRVDLA